MREEMILLSNKNYKQMLFVILLIEMLLVNIAFSENNGRIQAPYNSKKCNNFDERFNSADTLSENPLISSTANSESSIGVSSYGIQAENYTSYLWTNDIVLQNDVNYVFDLKIVADSEDNIHVIILGKINDNTGMYHKIFFKNNQSWSELKFIGTAATISHISTMDVVAGQNGTIHLTYQLSGVWYRLFRNEVWEDGIEISPGLRPKIQTDFNGLPKILFYVDQYWDYEKERWISERFYLAEQLINSTWVFYTFFDSFPYGVFNYDLAISYRNNQEIVDMYVCGIEKIYEPDDGRRYLFYHISKSNISEDFSSLSNFQNYEGHYWQPYGQVESLLIADHDGILHLFVNIPYETENRLYYQTYNGTVWKNPITLVQRTTDYLNIRANKAAAVEPSNRLAFIWSYGESINYSMVGKMQLKTYQEANGWSETEDIHSYVTYAKYPSIVFDSIGDAHLVWWEMIDDEQTIRYKYGYGDSDGDGLLNKDEQEIYGTDPFDFDTDDDEFSDGEEISLGFDPLNPDEDEDGMYDGWEYHHGLDPYIDDSNDDLDIDLLLNIEEFLVGTYPDNNDTDADDVSDYDEVKIYFTNPLHEDTDGDQVLDGIEIYDLNSNPNNPDTDADGMDDYYEYTWQVVLDILVNDSYQDPDGDGLLNIYEYQWNINPSNPDHDGDGLNDYDEVIVYFTQPTIPDTDGDGLMDGEEVHTYGTDPNEMDSDNDYVDDKVEIDNGFDPLNNDTDNDLMLDGYEWLFGLDPLNDADANYDYDSDGLVNYQESLYWSDPFLEDTDNDNLTDKEEVDIGTNPILPDTDGDLLDDYLEIMFLYTNATNIDTDYDGLTDYQEYIIYQTNPTNADTDGDFLNDGDEVLIYGTDPVNEDTDGEGLSDGDEVALGTNPLNRDTEGDGMDDYWEISNNLNPLVDDASGDADSDGVSNLTEYQFASNPQEKDTDQDKLTDYQEIYEYGTSPINNDTDFDGLTDYDELMIYHTSPLDIDTDDDRINDGEEVLIGTNPTLFDTDGDGDGQEIKDGTDPLNPNDNKLKNVRNFVIALTISAINFLFLYYFIPTFVMKIRTRKVRKELNSKSF
ncbi:MAG: hypothetical protein HZR80_04800 [Candidatus Heimdallarchaeota archaeon]